jgi:hypothetical protein
MSGWQRIGVVISLLWIVVFPIEVLREHNNSISDLYGQCFQRQMKYFPERPLDQAHEECAGIFVDFIRPSDLLNVSGHKVVPFFWLIVLLPVAVFWILGGATLWIIRWVRRGFKGSI